MAREEGRRMGLDAFVPCNCFEEGRISRPPEPFRMDDLYRDEEGYICSRRLDRYCEELGYSRYIELYGKLDDAFHSWTLHACEHEDGESIYQSGYQTGLGCASSNPLSRNLAEKNAIQLFPN